MHTRGCHAHRVDWRTIIVGEEVPEQPTEDPDQEATTTGAALVPGASLLATVVLPIAVAVVLYLNSVMIH